VGASILSINYFGLDAFRRAIDRSIALALIAGGARRKGERLFVPMPERTIPVTVVDPAFYDPRGASGPARADGIYCRRGGFVDDLATFEVVPVLSEIGDDQEQAARSLGAKRSYILYREVLPNLVAPILVYSTLLIPTNILFEAALSFLGVSVRPPQPTWGGMLSDATSFYQIDAEFLFPAGLAIFVTVLAFNLLGDGLRDALDPRSR